MRFQHKSIVFLSLLTAIILCTCSLAVNAAWAATSRQETQKQEQTSSAPSPTTTMPAAQSAAPKLDKPAQVLPPGIDSKTGQPLYKQVQEDWSSLSVGVSKLEPKPPVVAQTEEQGTFVRTLVQVQWRPGDPLDLWIILPKKVQKPPVVLYLYGYKEDTDRFRNNGWCERVTAGGVAAVGFVSALTGPRFQSRPMEQWFVSELQESLGSTVHDVHFILDYLAQRGDVDMNRVGMFGEGSGGTIAILSAAADSRIKAVDALDPWGDWPVWLAKSPVVEEDIHHTNFATPEFLKKVQPLDPVKWLPTLASARIRIQQVKDNDNTPLACQEALRNAAPKQAEVDEFDHVNQLAAAEKGGRLFDWIKDELRRLPPPAQSVAAEAQPQSSQPPHQSAREH